MAEAEPKHIEYMYLFNRGGSDGGYFYREEEATEKLPPYTSVLPARSASQCEASGYLPRDDDLYP